MATITIDVPDEDEAQALIEKYGKKKEFPDWEELGEVKGYYVDEDSNIDPLDRWLPDKHNRNVRATKAQAEASIAMAQLSQLLKHCNGDWIPDWRDNNRKYVIYFGFNKIMKCPIISNSRFLAFPTAEKRDGFLEAYRELIEKCKILL